ncbi:MAG: hypothetical protein S4CHLAM37_15050 [Chlamydiia bacterium]|nr:hypothetical protein [Chlamydiia bacterium]
MSISINSSQSVSTTSKSASDTEGTLIRELPQEILSVIITEKSTNENELVAKAHMLSETTSNADAFEGICETLTKLGEVESALDIANRVVSKTGSGVFEIIAYTLLELDNPYEAFDVLSNISGAAKKEVAFEVADAFTTRKEFDKVFEIADMFFQEPVDRKNIILKGLRDIDIKQLVEFDLNIDSALASIAEIPSADDRDEAHTILVHALKRRSDFGQAMQVAELINSPDLKESLLREVNGIVEQQA